MPITIGGMTVGKGMAPSKRDRKNPSAPICTCLKKDPALKAKVPVPGITIGFWEPSRLVEVTRTPYCIANPRKF